MKKRVKMDHSSSSSSSSTSSSSSSTSSSSSKRRRRSVCISMVTVLGMAFCHPETMQ